MLKESAQSMSLGGLEDAPNGEGSAEGNTHPFVPLSTRTVI
jgi:hypothetical protein